MEDLFHQEYEYITETLTIGEDKIILKGIEPDYGQVDACLSQVSLLFY